MNRSLKFSLALSLLAIVGTGCSATADDDVQENAQYQSQAKITLDQAKQTAESAQGGTAIGIQIDKEDNVLVYEVDFVDADVTVDAGTGDILATRPNDDRVKDTQYQSLAKITLDQAKQTAESAQGETAIGVQLDEEDNSLVYKVEFVASDVFVDAGTGEILATELESDSTDAQIRGSIQVTDN